VNFTALTFCIAYLVSCVLIVLGQFGYRVYSWVDTLPQFCANLPFAVSGDCFVSRFEAKPSTYRPAGMAANRFQCEKQWIPLSARYRRDCALFFTARCIFRARRNGAS